MPVQDLQDQPRTATCGDPTNPSRPAQRPGCGAEVDLTADSTRIAAVRWRTYLCPTCHEAGKAAVQAERAEAE
jgi:hypothetical protein